MRLVILCVLICSCAICYATGSGNLYVVVKDNVPQGVARISQDKVVKWSKSARILYPVGEEYAGLEGYKIKVENDGVRKATDAEINAYVAKLEADAKALKRKQFLDAVGINENDIKKIKRLKP